MYKYHIFCCVNEREPGNIKGCCQSKASLTILEFFKKTVRERGLKKSVRVTECGCLAACRFGPSVVVYPEGVWYSVPKPEDAREILEKHIVGGEPVEKFWLMRRNV